MQADEGVTVLAVAKMIGTVFGLFIGAIIAVVGQDGVAIGGTLVVVASFATFLVRMIVKNQDAVWRIVREKDRQLAKAETEKEYVTWEREAARHRANEREDPGSWEEWRRRTSSTTST